MKKLWNRCNRGQALVMVTVALFAMCGIMGLAVDLGWAYFVKKNAQSAADGAAWAAALQALTNVGPVSTVGCAAGVACSSPVDCPASDNLANGCAYAAKNGFSHAVNANQKVTMQSGLGAPPTAPNIPAEYWVTARAVETVPQLFSAVLGNTYAVPASRATAVIIESVVRGALILLNRENDAAGMAGGGRDMTGVNIAANGNNTITAPGGILMASANATYAADDSNNTHVQADFTFVRGNGGVRNTSDWVAAPVNGQPDGQDFYDPMRGYPQPPLTTNGSPITTAAHPITANLQGDGVIAGGTSAANPVVLPPGHYYAVDQNGMATGGRINISGYVKFSNGGNGFGDFVFYGGVSTLGGAANITLDPGRYIFAGTKPAGGQTDTGGYLFDIDNGTVLQDNTAVGGTQSDAGELFIFTDPHYPGLTPPAALTPVLDSLDFGQSGFHTGATAQNQINLHGLNTASSSLPAELAKYQPFISWQDRANSRVRYDPSTNDVDQSCGGLNTPCTNTLEHPNSPNFYFLAGPDVHYSGAFYQPRGAWTTFQGGSNTAMNVQLITGAINLGGGNVLNLQSVSNPIRRRTVALVE
jgi:Flp pilus assembly protein TadG